MRWKKRGLVFEPTSRSVWMCSHSSNPVAEPVDDDFVRVYFSTRDAQNRSSIATVEIDLSSPGKFRRLTEEPVLSPGSAGLFDDSGVSMSCLATIKGRRTLFYLGWNLGTTVPWRNAIGAAVQNPATGRFEKVSQAPVMDRSDEDPYSLSYCYVLPDDGRYWLWYGSNLSWGPDKKDMAHVIKVAESDDGRSWQRGADVAVNFKDAGEYALSKPCVIKENGLFKMWYSYRGPSYRIGYAESKDGRTWTRKDEQAGIDVSSSGWDSEMIEYPFVFDHRGQRYLLYNGNGFGRTGIGLAVLEQD